MLMTCDLLADVEHGCDRIAIMHRGMVQAEGAVGDLLLRSDTIRFLVSGLSDAEAAPLRDELAARLGRDVVADHPAVTLEAFFLDVIARAAGKPTMLTHFHPAPFLVRAAPRPAAGAAPANPGPAA